MKFEPRDYQAYATGEIIKKPAVGLFLDCGLGKTASTLTALDKLLFDYFDVCRPLVIAPLRVARETWPDEVQKWDHLRHLRLSLVLGPEKERIAALRSKADIWVINRENVAWLVNRYGKHWPFDMVVIDELSSFKSPSAIRFKKLRAVRPLIRRVVGLTGTPAPNGLMDLWAQVYLLDSGERLGKTVTSYRERYFIPDKGDGFVVYSYKPKPEAEKVIYDKISDICVSMKSEDWIKLPERIDNVVNVKLGSDDRAAYDTLERDQLLRFMDGEIVANHAGILVGKLLQMCNGAVYDENRDVKEFHTAKLEALKELIEEANGKPVLVFYSYKHDLTRIQKFLADFRPRKLDKPQDIKDWNARRIGVALAHPASTGHGLNLQAGGNQAVWYGLTHNLELYIQANKRLHRPGQREEKVIIHHLIVKNTIEEEVMYALKHKIKTQDTLMEAIKARVSKIM